MRITHGRLRDVLLLILVVAGPAGAVVASSGPVSGATPRYAFRAGQHLVYEGDEVAETTSGRLGLERHAELFVVRENGDGSWRIVMTHRHKRFNDRNGVRQNQPARSELYYLDVFPDGRIPQRASDTFGNVNRILPVLPDRADSGVWTFDAGDVTLAGTVGRPVDEGGLSFDVVPTSALWELQGFSATYTYDFDLEAGVIRSIAVQHRHKGRDTRKGVDRLDQDEMLADDVLAALVSDVDAAEAAERAHERAVAHALGASDPSAAQKGLDAALAVLERARDGLARGLLREHLDVLALRHRHSGPTHKTRIALSARLVDRPAPTWTLDDLDGRSHSLSGYRGRVVVLDFWYRACGWCIRGMPQLEAVKRRFADRAVSVIGMNTDRNVDDARLVVDKLRMSYPSLRTDRNVDDARLVVDKLRMSYPSLRTPRSLAQAYGVRAYPTLVVIDGNGVLRHVHTGYAADLADELGEIIDGLLEEMGPAGEVRAKPVSLEVVGDRVDVAIGGRPFTSFHVGDVQKPYLHPIIAPGGQRVTRGFPMEPGPDDATDHPHHVSMWFAHGDVNGHDFWHGPKGERIVLVRGPTTREDRDGGTVTASFEWRVGGNRVVCTEDRTMRFRGDETTRTIDFDIRLTASGGSLTFGDTKEGTFAVRLAPALQLAGPVAAGSYRNAEGLTGGACWGKRSAWVDDTGSVDGRTVGVTIFDHPENPRHPTWWHAREYGLLAANAFGAHDFEGGPEGAGDLTIPAGASLRFRYRLIVRDGAWSAEEIASKFASYE